MNKKTLRWCAPTAMVLPHSRGCARGQPRDTLRHPVRVQGGAPRGRTCMLILSPRPDTGTATICAPAALGRETVSRSLVDDRQARLQKNSTSACAPPRRSEQTLHGKRQPCPRASVHSDPLSSQLVTARGNGNPRFWTDEAPQLAALRRVGVRVGRFGCRSPCSVIPVNSATSSRQWNFLGSDHTTVVILVLFRSS